MKARHPRHPARPPGSVVERRAHRPRRTEYSAHDIQAAANAALRRIEAGGSLVMARWVAEGMARRTDLCRRPAEAGTEPSAVRTGATAQAVGIHAST